MTHAGNTHARRVLVEGAWAYSLSRQGQPTSATATGKTPHSDPGHPLESPGAGCVNAPGDLWHEAHMPIVVTVAIARELSGMHVGHCQAGAS